MREMEHHQLSFGGWTTQNRMHDVRDLLPSSCIFGCAGAMDDWKHYAGCPLLWGCVCEACDVSANTLFGGLTGASDKIAHLITHRGGCIAFYVAFKLP